MPQNATRQGNLLRSSEMVQARKMKTKMPRKEMRFCIAAALYPRYGLSNALNHLGSQFGIDGYGERFFRRLLADRQAARAIAKGCKAFLKMKGLSLIHISEPTRLLSIS